jgi:uncharacterized protein YeaO (DUF488 family)
MVQAKEASIDSERLGSSESFGKSSWFDKLTTNGIYSFNPHKQNPFALSLSKGASMSLRTKRIYEPPSPEDGYRLLVMRRWPRGIRKQAVDSWDKELAPSEPLRVAYRGGDMPWEEYARRYVEEVSPKRELLAQVARRAQSQPVTLLCSCVDENRCHRSLLRGLVEGIAG